jgi:hypothetical protein
VPRERDRIAAAEFMVAGDFTALGFTVVADFLAAGSTVGLADFTGDLLDFLTADFTTADFMLTDFPTANFTLMGFTASGSIIMASAEASSWSLPSVACR